MLQLISFQQVFAELHAEVNGDLSEGAFAAGEFLEMLIGDDPLFMLALRQIFDYPIFSIR